MQSSYVIYNASAGSGKTYGLVKAYLRIVLASKNADLFRSLLAITFTNKAVFEMKSRIIEMLDIFSDPKSLSEPHPMFNELCQELKIAPAELIQRSDNVLRHILHNYTSFNISTIDGFNHQLIRNFAFDLQLNQFFEVQLDSNTLLQQAVDNLMSLAGSDDQLTKLLTDFSSEKIKDDHHWDTSKELLEVARMLTNENHYWELNSLKNKEFSDFKALKTNLHQKKEQAYKNIKQTSIDFFNLLENNELDRTAFNRGSVFDFFRKLNENPEYQPKWDQQWQENLADPNAPLYGKTNAKKLNTTLIDSLKPLIFQYFITTKKAIGQFNFCKNALRLVVPLALLRQIQNEIERIKEEKNILPIWEFNNLISNEITSQPAPFIYERIGERFRHYFIDEFQDTSVLQWNNFIPLILNAVQSENTAKQRGSVLLVGDAKQSIYRWRGGKAEQFMDLYLGESNPFFVKGKVVDLEDNFRSLPAIIDFNNAFFTFVSSIFKSEKYKNLYVNAVQNYPKSKAEKNLPNGFLNIEFVDLQIDTEEENDEFSEFDFLSERELTYCQSILNTIERVNSVGVNDKDITILVRTNKEGSAVASFLSSKGRNIISPDALLLANVPAVRFLISLLSSIYTPKNQEVKIQLLFDFITIKDITEVHSFVVKYKDVPLENFFSDYGFSIAQFNSYSLYEGVVYAVNCFNLARESDAYLTHFLDLIFDFKNARKGGISDFLTFWEEESDKLSISSPEGLDAITIMTVHKSKGLASPVIIYAFADSPLTNSRNQTIWYPVCEQEYSGFSSLLIQKNKNLHIFEEKSEEIINQHQEQQILDQINVLYVGMTRPESFLFIISALPNEKKVTYGTLFKDFLTQKQIWNDDLRSYSFGELTFPTPKDKQTQQNTNIIFQKGWITPNYKIATGAALLWDNNRKESIEKGNLMHSLLSKINFHSDLELVLKSAINEGVITTEHYHFIYPQLKAILNNELISDFFTDKYDYFTEREFLSHNGKYFRPDRIALKKKSKQAFIIDYKTGKFDTKHKHQLHHYAQILSDLGWIIQGKFLVYLDENKVVSI